MAIDGTLGWSFYPERVSSEERPSPPVRLEAVKGRSGRLGYLIDAIMTGTWPTLPYGRSSHVDIVNREGERVMVIEAASFEEATDACRRLEEEACTIGLTAWCEKYGVRESWVEAG
jgi:hypothetical protein